MPRFPDGTSAWNTTSTTGADTSFNMGKLLQGPLPRDIYGLNYAGANDLSKIAHRSQQMQQIDNWANNGVSDQLEIYVKDANGAVTLPFDIMGDTVYPDEKGQVRITDAGKIAQAKEIYAFQVKKVDDLMENAMISDEICSYMFGVPLKKWLEYCDKGGCPDGCYMEPEMKALKCTWEYIDAMPPSLTQYQATSKRRKLVKHFAKNVNLKYLTNKPDEKKNMKDGHNNPNKLDDNGMFKKEKDAMKANIKAIEDEHSKAYE
jgi:hypothetical protein